MFVDIVDRSVLMYTWKNKKGKDNPREDDKAFNSPIGEINIPNGWIPISCTPTH